LKIRGQQNQIRLVRPHPFRERAVVGKPTTNELPARIHGTVFVNAAFVRNTEWAGLSREDILAANVDPQPAVATGRAFHTCSGGI
jgi:hypothetical protein